MRATKKLTPTFNAFIFIPRVTTVCFKLYFYRIEIFPIRSFQKLIFRDTFLLIVGEPQNRSPSSFYQIFLIVYIIIRYFNHWLYTCVYSQRFQPYPINMILRSIVKFVPMDNVRITISLNFSSSKHFMYKVLSRLARNFNRTSWKIIST